MPYAHLAILQTRTHFIALVHEAYQFPTGANHLELLLRELLNIIKNALQYSFLMLFPKKHVNNVAIST